MNINQANYEEYLVNKLEGLLNRDEIKELDSFMHKHPELLTEWETLKQTVLIANKEIVFADKASLKKPERRRRVVPIYRYLLITSSVAASLVFVIYIGVFKINKTDNPVVASYQATMPPASSAGNNVSQTVVNSVNPVSTTNNSVQNITADAARTTHHHTVQSNHPLYTVARSTGQQQNSQSPSVPVEMASLTPEPFDGLPVAKTKIHLRPYKLLRNVQVAAVSNPQPADNTEPASLIQFASAVGTQLYRLSGRGEISTGKQQAPAANDMTISVKTKRFTLLKTFRLHPKHQTI